MTSDAKIGLILGLAFIVLIAFLLTGLPAIFNGSGANRGIRTKLPPTGVSVVIDDQAENAMRAIEDMGIHEDVEERQIDIGRDTAGDARFGSGSNGTSVATGGRERVNQPTAKRMRIYVVQGGDNLAKIAKKAYGPEEGNRFVTINKIFEANKNIMSSPDDVKIGQKLVIPSLAVETTPATLREAEEAGMFSRVRNVLGIGNAVNRGVQRVYVVKDGDTLWDIASKHLGDGSRYKEIVKLNRSSVGNSDIVDAGLRLKMPVN